MMSKQFAIIVILLTIVSCKNKQEMGSVNNRYPTNIKVNLSEAVKDTLVLSDIAYKTEYIPLQTVENAMLGNILNFVIARDKIFIKYNQSIQTFDKNGTYLNSLFKTGRGPGESFARCFAVDETNERVFVYEDANHDVKIYDYDGNYSKTIKTPIAPLEYWIYSIGYFNNSLFVHTAQRPYVKYLYSCFNLNNDSITILYKNYRNYEKSQESKAPLAPYDYHYQITDSTILFKERFSDTIFSVNSSFTRIPRFIIDLGSGKLDWLTWRDHGMFDISGGPPSGYQVQSFVESQSFLFLALNSFKEQKIFVAYDKTRNKVKILKGLHGGSSQKVYIKNDLDRIAKFSPMNDDGYLFYYSNALYCVLDASDFADAYKKVPENVKKATNYLKEMAPNFIGVTEFSNPVIMKIYLK